MAWIVLLVLIVSLRSFLWIPQVEDSIQSLEFQNTLAHDGAIYLRRQKTSLGLYASGWGLKDFPIVEQLRVGGKAINLAAVDKIIPISPPPQKRLLTNPDPEEAALEGTVTSASDLIGVELMPARFFIEFDDGSIWYIYSDEGHRLIEWPAVQMLHCKLIFSLFRTNLAGNPFNFWLVKLEENNAKELFWVLQKGMKVIH